MRRLEHEGELVGKVRTRPIAARPRSRQPADRPDRFFGFPRQIEQAGIRVFVFDDLLHDRFVAGAATRLPLTLPDTTAFARLPGAAALSSDIFQVTNATHPLGDGLLA